MHFVLPCNGAEAMDIAGVHRLCNGKQYLSAEIGITKAIDTGGPDAVEGGAAAFS